jgi:NAD(P)-dependent dehydrogenase (short-subunit alcohol dehydrogenase family)
VSAVRWCGPRIWRRPRWDRGIGKATAIGLAALGARVGIASRRGAHQLRREDQAAHFAVLIRAARPFMKTAAQGAVTPVYLAKTAYDTTAAARLWQVSADLAELTATA